MYIILFQDKAKSMLHLYNRLGKSDLVMPGRELVKEGELERIFRSKTVARYFVLLSDCLLYCSYVGPVVDDNSKLHLSHTIPLKELRVVEPGQDDPHQTEFRLTSSVASFIIQAK